MNTNERAKKSSKASNSSNEGKPVDEESRKKDRLEKQREYRKQYYYKVEKKRQEEKKRQKTGSAQRIATQSSDFLSENPPLPTSIEDTTLELLDECLKGMGPLDAPLGEGVPVTRNDSSTVTPSASLSSEVVRRIVEENYKRTDSLLNPVKQEVSKVARVSEEIQKSLKAVENSTSGVATNESVQEILRHFDKRFDSLEKKIDNIVDKVIQPKLDQLINGSSEPQMSPAFFFEMMDKAKQALTAPPTTFGYSNAPVAAQASSIHTPMMLPPTVQVPTRDPEPLTGRLPSGHSKRVLDRTPDDIRSEYREDRQRSVRPRMEDIQSPTSSEPSPQEKRRKTERGKETRISRKP